VRGVQLAGAVVVVTGGSSGIGLLLSVPYALAPGTTARVAALLGRWYLLRSGPPAPPYAGGLAAEVAGPAQARGGWEPRTTEEA
jgi:NAD(P)-dependent dehydrogenase (short-subunit alcohol dehydrogenase family)